MTNLQVDRFISIRHFTDKLRPFLDDRSVTEICINRPDEVYTLSGRWKQYDTDFSLDALERFSRAVAKASTTTISENRPLLSGVLECGERIQIIRPPACEDRTYAITIRKPSEKIITLDQYSRQGFFQPETDRERLSDPLLPLYALSDKREFLTEAVRMGKVIVIAGGTGSGKTTLLRTLIELIPYEHRIITVEDTAELPVRQPNHVHLFTGEMGATQMIKATMRMKPDVIIMGEIRGEEAFDFIRVVNSGHGGSLVTVHASDCATALENLSLYVGMSAQGARLPDATVRRLLHSAVDVVAHISNQKRISEVWYKGAENA